MQKTRTGRKGSRTASEGGAERTPVGKGRPTHVRNRLIVAVAVVAAAIAGAGAPALLTASGQLKDSQDLVTLAEQTEDALALARSLADERDEVTSYVAAGRPDSEAPSAESGARVDRQARELTAETDVTADLRDALDSLTAVRRTALTGEGTALEAHDAYSKVITALHGLAERLAEQTPARAGSGAHALVALDTAVQQASATRGLLLAALRVPSATQTVIDPVTGLASTEKVSSEADTERRDALTAAAQQSRVRSDAALADFRASAPEDIVESYDSTVTGGDVDTAEKYLARLTDQPTLSAGELATGVKKLDAALSARVDLMRGAESSLYGGRADDLAALRDDDVTGLEIRIALLGALMLLAVAVSTGMARSLTRPLSVLRRGSARLAGAENPAAEEPVTFTGRNDEFAQVVRSVNALHAHAVAVHERVATLESDRKHLVGQRQAMADAREELRAEIAESADRLERLRSSITGTFVNLALRTLGLVERQLGVIETLEEREQDPDRLATLFKLDHFATVMRRHSENLLVLAGTEHVQQHAGPIPLVDVVRAAVSEIERYERVRISALPPHAHVAGFAADDLSHLLAELMENATSFSPPDLPVEVSGWLLESGEVMLSVQDEGIGIPEDRLTALNARLTDFDPETPYDQEGEEGLGLGLYVVARLAHRHGVRVQLREQKQGGVAAVVVLPATLLPEAPSAAVPSSAPASARAQSFSLPGADAEANSNVLPGRPKPADPLVALAENAVRAAGEESRGETVPRPRKETPAEALSGPRPETRPAASPETRTDLPAESRTDGLADAQADTRAEARTDALADTRADASAETRAETRAESRTDALADARADARAEARAEARTDALADARADASAETPVGTAAGAPAGRPPVPADADGEAGFETPARVPAQAERDTAAGPDVSPDAEPTPGTPAAFPAESPAETTMELLLPVPPAEGDPARPEAQAQVSAQDRDSAQELDPAKAQAPSQAQILAQAQAQDVDPAQAQAPALAHASAQDPAQAPDLDPAQAQALAQAQAQAPDPALAHASAQDPNPAQASTQDLDPARTPAQDLGPAQDLNPDAAKTQAPAQDPNPAPAKAQAPAPDPAPKPDSPQPPTPPTSPLPPAPAEAQEEHARVPDLPEEPVTGKGLPKRTPRITAPVQTPRQRSGSVDAEALRRRLGGFRRGAEAGYREVEAEIAEKTGQNKVPAPQTAQEAHAHAEEDTGGTVEEASS
ncbi:nitrate- and nitrite sensing domain-containing protein [Streptomyces antibioticus]|uniref:sensor histidine kinase n=1 Tax=Streptomyces antibioticus TaxID=1890 RepID=UPI0033BFA553